MPRSFSEDEWVLLDLPRQLAYEKSWFDNPYIGQAARVKHAALLARQTELKYRIRRSDVLDRWIMRRYRCRGSATACRGAASERSPIPVAVSPDLSGPETSSFTPMLIDEVIQDGKIVDRG